MQSLTDQYLLYRTAYLQDPEAFAELHRRYFEKIYSFVLWRVASKEDAEDLVSQVFLQAWEALTRKPTDKSHFKGFIYKIARNEVIDWYRARGKTPALISLDKPDEYVE